MQLTRSNDATAPFIGVWALESFTEALRDGSSVEPMGKYPSGFLVYTKEGIVSAQLAISGKSHDEHPSDTPEAQRTMISYIGYCGTFAVNSTLQKVVHTPIVANDRNLLGSELNRTFRFDGDRLTLETSSAEVGEGVITARLVWRRYHQV